MRREVVNVPGFEEIELDDYWKRRRGLLRHQGLLYGASAEDASRVADIEARFRQHAATVVGNEFANELRFGKIKTDQFEGFELHLRLSKIGITSLIYDPDFGKFEI